MIKINAGCGKRNFGKDWIHIDEARFPHIDYYDIKNLSFEDCSVDLIYSSHVIEYFDRDEIQKLLIEWNRVLKKDGTLRLAVPDFEVVAKLYLDPNNDYGIERFLGALYGRMPMNDLVIYHKTCYDFNSLRGVLEASGFRNVRRFDWRKTEHADHDDFSQAYLPHMDKDNGVLISLNIECTK